MKMEYNDDRMDTYFYFIYNSENISQALCNTKLLASNSFNGPCSTSQSLLSEGMENSTLLASYDCKI